MSRKTAVVAFKVEEELARILNGLPNKSEFIRQAIASHLNMACPLCRGTGVLSKSLHDYYSSVLPKVTQKDCESCGHTVSLASEPGALAPEDRTRLEQFFVGGPILCDDCYEKAPPCDDCGWHISPDQVKKHQRQAHTHSR
jgi:hypothetical protein